MRYNQIQDGEWVTPRMRNYYMQCCNCGASHRVNFKLTKRGIKFQAFRIRKRASRK